MTIRSRSKAVELYFKLRNGMDKRKLAPFEGQRFFRFGNSWRRLSADKLFEVILLDSGKKLEVEACNA